MHVWFHLHRATQLLGLSLFIGSFALAVNQFEGKIPEYGLGRVHRHFGIAVFAAACLQVRAAHECNLHNGFGMCSCLPRPKATATTSRLIGHLNHHL